MANINLFKSVQQNEATANIAERAKRGFVLPSIFLLIVLLLWGGIQAFSMVQAKKSAGVDGQISMESESLNGKDADSVADFQGRLDKITQFNNGKNDPDAIFGQLQNSIVQNSQITDLKYTGDAADVKFMCDDFSVVAKEILSFKKSDFFGNVMIDSISRDSQTGKIVLELTMAIKNKS